MKKETIEEWREQLEEKWNYLRQDYGTANVENFIEKLILKKQKEAILGIIPIADQKAFKAFKDNFNTSLGTGFGMGWNHCVEKIIKNAKDKFDLDLK